MYQKQLDAKESELSRLRTQISNLTKDKHQLQALELELEQWRVAVDREKARADELQTRLQNVTASQAGIEIIKEE